MLRIGLPSGVQHSLVSLGFVAMTRIVNPFGTNVIAGFTAASRLDSFAAMPAMNLSVAVSTFVGQNLGAGKPERVRKGFASALAIGLGISAVLTVIMVTMPSALIRLFSADAEVVRIGAEYLVIVSLFYLVFAAMFITGGVLRGAGDTMVQMVITLFGLWVIRVPAAAILSRVMGTRGIWWAIAAGWTLGFVASFLYYLTGRWKTRVITRPGPATTSQAPAIEPAAPAEDA